jgi:hypothetical protein
VRYWIRDEDDTPQGFPLKKLLQLIIRQLGSSVFQLWILRSQGYGLRIKEWDELLDKQERLLMDKNYFKRLVLALKIGFMI